MKAMIIETFHPILGKMIQINKPCRIENYGGWESPEVGQRELLKRGVNRVKYGNGVMDTVRDQCTGTIQRITFEN